MTSHERSLIAEACEEISAQIERITESLDGTDLTADEIRALQRCEQEMTKLEANAWSKLCKLITSDLLLEETEETVRRTDEAIDALNADPK